VRIIVKVVSVGACVVAALGVAGCGGGASAPDGETVSPSSAPVGTGQETPAAPPSGESVQEQPAAPSAVEGEQSAQEWAMPGLVGMVLQDAQDQVQSLTGGAVYFTDSHDLTGQGRNQVLDDNWQVCTQNIAPGAVLTAASRVDLGVVKVGEACP
jgi:hypothetical protein